MQDKLINILDAILEILITTEHIEPGQSPDDLEKILEGIKDLMYLQPPHLQRLLKDVIDAFDNLLLPAHKLYVAYITEFMQYVQEYNAIFEEADSIEEFCTHDCPRYWIGDYYCDDECNNEGCLYDDGDC